MWNSQNGNSKNYHSVLDYCLDTIKRGEKDPNNEFIFSSLKFLYEKVDDKPVFEYNERMAILNYIYTTLSEAKFRNRTATIPSSLSDEQKIIIERYIDTIIRLDSAVKYYETFISKKHLIPIHIKEALQNRFSQEEPKNEMSELLKEIITNCENNGWPIYHSYYYRLCECYARYYDSKCIDEFRAIVDICYNEVVALSLNDNAELNISPDFSKLASIQASENSTEHSSVTTSQIISDVRSKLDWESIVLIYTEVNKISESTGKNWMEALDVFRSKQASLPFVISGKYALITSLTMAVSSVPFIGTITGGIVSQFMWNIICDVSGEVVKKPSVSEIVSMSKQAKKNNKILGILITQKKR